MPLTNELRDDILASVPSLRAFAISLSGNGDRADDLVQETLLRALANIDSFQPGSNLPAWLFTILRNRFRSVIARKHVTAEVPDDDLERHSWAPAEQESRIEVAAFKRAFRALSAAHREVLVLVAVHGLPYEQVAEICGCEVGTVKSRVNRARAMLKKMLLDDALPVDPRKMPTAARAQRLEAPEEADLLEAGHASRLQQAAGHRLAALPRRSLN